MISPIKGWQALAVGLLFFIPIFYASFTGIYSADIYWHLKSGEDFLFNGLNPYKDHYSIDYLGETILNYSVIYDSLAALFYNLFGGETGLQALRLVFLTLPLIVLLAMVHRKKLAIEDGLLAAAILVAGLTFRKLVRPEMMSYSFSLVFIYFLFNKKISNKALLFLSGLLFVWQYCHGTSVFGFIYFGGILLNQLIGELFGDRSFKRILLVVLIGLASLALSWANPMTASIILSYLKTDLRWGEWLDEILVKSLSDHFLYYLILLYVTLLALFGALAIRNVGALCVYGIFLFFSLFVSKMDPHISVLLAGSFVMFRARSLQPVKIPQSWLDKIKKKFDYEKYISMDRLLKIDRMIRVCLILGIVGYIAQQRILLVFKEKFNPKPAISAFRLPVDLLDHFKENPPQGRAINTYIMGGYLQYHLGPDLKMMIDGRTNILFPFEYFAQYVKAARDVGYFREMQQEKSFNYVIGSLNHHNRILDVALESGLFGIDYLSSHNGVLKPITESAYPKSSYYFRFPQCAKNPKKVYQDLRVEKNKADLNLPKDSRLRFYLQTLQQYFSHPKKVDYLKSLLDQGYIYGSSLRFAAYRALELKDHNLAISLFQKAGKELKARDLLVLVELLCKHNKCQGAYPHFLRNVDKIMPNWRRDVLRKEWDVLKKVFGETFTTPDVIAEINERLAIDPSQQSVGSSPYPCR